MAQTEVLRERPSEVALPDMADNTIVRDTDLGQTMRRIVARHRPSSPKHQLALPCGELREVIVPTPRAVKHERAATQERRCVHSGAGALSGHASARWGELGEERGEEVCGPAVGRVDDVFCEEGPARGVDGVEGGGGGGGDGCTGGVGEDAETASDFTEVSLRNCGDD